MRKRRKYIFHQHLLFKIFDRVLFCRGIFNENGKEKIDLNVKITIEIGKIKYV